MQSDLVHSGQVVGESNGLSCILCDSCGFRHLDPIPDNASLYSRGVYHRCLKPEMSDSYSEDAEWWQAIHSDWLSMIQSRIPNRRLLDAGSGTGHFLANARAMGFVAVGIEPDFEMARRRSDVVWCEYQDYAGRGYGCVSAHWVLEHLADPAHFLQWARERLDPDGLLLVTVPNDFSPLQFEAMNHVGKPYYWLHRAHINYWSVSEFSVFLRRHGFAVTDYYGSWMPERHLLDGQNYLDDPALGAQLHRARVKHDLEIAPKYRRSKYSLMGMMGMGRDVTYVAARKP